MLIGDIGDFISGQGGNNLVALLALLFSIGMAVIGYFREKRVDLREKAIDEREARIEERDNRVEKSTAYLQLEVHSSEAFRFAAEHCEVMRPYESTNPPVPAPKRQCRAAETTRQYYFQCLNLFEVCSNFRRHGVIEKQVYASWVSWFHEVLDQWYFRELWLDGMRDNYTRDVRHIFDMGVQIYSQESDPEARRQAFYRAVSHALGGCEVIDKWLDELAEMPQWPPVEHGKLAIAKIGGSPA